MKPTINTDEINDLIRIAQVLKMRCGLLADELAKKKRGPLSGAAINASDSARASELKLAHILREILG